MHSTSRVLILYSTTDGHTQKICHFIQRLLEQSAYQVVLMSVDEGIHQDCSNFDRIVIGASIRYGKHQPALYDFIEKHRATLVAVPNAFFSVSAVARKTDKDTPSGNAYFKKFVAQSGWSPKLAGMFGGKIDYAKYGFLDKHMIRLIMWMTKGPTSLDTPVEFTDWSAVENFALRIKNLPR